MRKDLDQVRPVSVGVSYVDSAACRRWALKTDHPKAMAQINSVL